LMLIDSLCKDYAIIYNFDWKHLKKSRGKSHFFVFAPAFYMSIFNNLIYKSFDSECLCKSVVYSVKIGFWNEY